MTFGACDLPEPSISPKTPAAAAKNETSFSNLCYQPKLQWLLGTTLVSFFLL